MTRALILAGGGILGIAWESGVLAGLEAAGIDTHDWDLVVGTSAGAYVGARLTLDGSPAPLFALETSDNDAAVEADLEVLFGTGFVRATRISRQPILRWVSWLWFATFVATTLTRFAARRGVHAAIGLVASLRSVRATADWQDLARRMGALAETKRGSATVLIEHWEHTLGRAPVWPSTRLIATAIDTGDGSRRLFDAASGAPLPAAVAASSCLPGLLAPVRLLGRRYMDGGIISSTNADVATGYDEVWVITPGASDITDREVETLRLSGSTVHLIRPGAQADLRLPSGMAAFDPSRRSAAARAGYDDGRSAAASRP